MIYSKTELEARLDAIKQLTDYDIKSVTIGYDKNKKRWYVERKVFTEEELEAREENER